MKWYQLHLSTLLVVSLLAAGLVWLNVRDAVFDGEIASRYVPYDTAQPWFAGRGWPWPFEIVCWVDSEVPQVDTLRIWKNLSSNIVLCFALLTTAAIAIEWLTRRMKRGAIKRARRL
ncbi:MAG TPA: hypothetical protein VEJ63_19910 [Planctomycetota bacterium]|nr:hypothetical protein [Planctomycetota bacterium]